MILEEQNQFVETFFKQVIQKSVINHAYLLEGPQTSEHLKIARYLIQSQFCKSTTPEGLPCLTCSLCKRIEQGSHPDVIEIKTDTASIKVDELRELIQGISRTGVEGNRHSVIIHDAEKMTTGAANALLKFLEEPLGNTTIILSTRAIHRILPTIISRSQVITFKAASPEKLQERLENQGVKVTQAQIFSYLCQNIEEAHEMMADEKFGEMVNEAFRFKKALDAGQPEAFVHVQSRMMNVIDKKRPSQRKFLEILIVLYRIDLHQTFQGKEEHHLFNERRVQIGMEAVLDALKMFERYVPLQSVLEWFTLEYLKRTQSS